MENELRKIAEIQSVFGYSTKAWRISLGLEKSHINDAIAMVIRSGPFFREAERYNISVRRRRRDMYNRKHSSLCGFMHFDLVTWNKRNCVFPVFKEAFSNCWLVDGDDTDLIGLFSSPTTDEKTIKRDG